MRNKIVKTLIFLLYSWFIYNSYLVILSAYFIYQGYLLHAISTPLSILTFYSFFMLVYNILKFIRFHIILGFLFSPYNLWLVIPIIIVNAVSLFFWLKKQTIARAWLLAMAGIICGPGLLCAVQIFNSLSPLILGSLCLSILYVLLIVSNYLQKRFYPDNKFANRIRKLLKWPCLRT